MELSERLVLVSHLAALSLLLCTGALLVHAAATLGRILERVDGRYGALVTADGPLLHRPLVLPAEGNGAARALADLLRRPQETVLLFLSPRCDACLPLLADLERRRPRDLPGPALVLVWEGDPGHPLPALRPRPGREPALLVADPGGRLRASLGIGAVPCALLVDAEGVLRMKGIVNTPQQLDGLVARRGRGFLRLDAAGEQELAA